MYNTVAQWLALLPHSKKVVVLIPSPPCFCVGSLCCLTQSKNIHVRLIENSKLSFRCEYECEWFLYLYEALQSTCWLILGVTLPSPMTAGVGWPLWPLWALWPQAPTVTLTTTNNDRKRVDVPPLWQNRKKSSDFHWRRNKALLWTARGKILLSAVSLWISPFSPSHTHTCTQHTTLFHMV